MSWKFSTESITTTGEGESIFTAGRAINTYFESLSNSWYAFIYPYNDARAQEVINVPFSSLDSTVVDYLTGSYYFDTTYETNLVMDKLYQIPEDMQQLMYYSYWNPESYQQKPGVNDTVRCLYYDGTVNKYRFANNKVLADSYSDFTGVIGNVYYKDKTVDLVLNGIIYNYSAEDFEPGEVYYLTDLMDGWMIPYSEGGDGDLVSVPMAVAVHKNSAILLTERAMTKDLPCRPKCPPTRLRFDERIIEYTPTNPPSCDSVALHIVSDDSSASLPVGDFSSFARPIQMSGNVGHTTASKRFGNSSIIFNGDEDTYLTTSNTGYYDLSSNDFTIEFWAQFNNPSGHEFIIGLWDGGLRRRGWNIECPSDSNGTGTGLVFNVNSGVDTDQWVIRLGCDYTFERDKWYHIALSRTGHPASIPGPPTGTVDDWHWLIDGIKQPNRLTGGRYNCTIPQYTGGRLVIGSPTIDAEIVNTSAISYDDYTVSGSIENIIDINQTKSVLHTMDAGSTTAINSVEFINPILGSDFYIQQVETSSAGDRLQLQFKSLGGAWETVHEHITSAGIHGISKVLPANWHNKEIHGIRWLYTPAVIASSGLNVTADGTEYFKLIYAEFQRGGNQLDWIILTTGRGYFTEPFDGYLDDLRMTVGESVYSGDYILPEEGHEVCYAGCRMLVGNVAVPEGLCEHVPEVGDVVALYDCPFAAQFTNAPAGLPDQASRPVVMKIADATDVLISHQHTYYGEWGTWSHLSAGEDECFANTLVSTGMNQGNVTYRMKYPVVAFALRHASGWRDSGNITGTWQYAGQFGPNPTYVVYYKYFDAGDNVLNNDSALFAFRTFEPCESPVVENQVIGSTELLIQSQQSSGLITTSTGVEDTTNRIYGFDIADPASYDLIDHTIVDLEGNSDTIQLSGNTVHSIENGGYLQHTKASCNSLDISVEPLNGGTQDVVTVELWAQYLHFAGMLFGWNLYDFISYVSGGCKMGFNLGEGGEHRCAAVPSSYRGRWKHYVLEFHKSPNMMQNKFWVDGVAPGLSNGSWGANGYNRANFNNGNCRLFGWLYNSGTSIPSQDGAIAKLNIYDGPLTADQIRNNFNANRGRFDL